MKKVLYIDKDNKFFGKLSAYFEADNISIEFSQTLQDSMSRVKSGSYCLVLISAEFCQNWLCEITDIRRVSDIPVVILAERKNTADTIAAFRIGVDDYILKSTEILEITLRIEALIHRYIKYIEQHTSNIKLITVKDITIDENKRSIYKNGIEIELTKTEYELISYLAHHKGQVLSREQLCEGIWSNEYVTDDKNIITHIHRLRMKIEDNPSEPEYILTARGGGYRLTD